MKIIWILLAISSICYAYDWSTNPGDGSHQNPYQISEPNQLIAIGSDSNLLTKHFILTQDIVFDPNHNPAHVFSQPVIAYGVLENGSGPRFTGSFNGNHKTIYNLKIVTSGPCRALFGAAKNAVIKNLNMKNTLIISDGNVAAGLIAFMDYGTILDHCFVSGQISGVQKVGGMVGLGPYSGYFPPAPVQPAAVITHCFSEGTVTGQMDVGGLVADFTGKISHCGTSATVQGTGVSMWIGGLAAYHGYNETSDLNIMTQCFSSGKVYGNDNSRFVGGLAACITAAAYDSYSSGTILVGNNSQDIGGFTAVMGAGGMISVHGSAVNCYSTASISAGEGSTGISGFCTEPGSLENCYFLASAGPDNGYGTPLDDPNMKIRNNFVDWDFVDDGSDGPNNFWRMCADGADYPRLSWEFGQGGDYACPDGVGMDDLEALAMAWLTADSSSDFNYAADGSGDGRIDQQDMQILSSHWKE